MAGSAQNVLYELRQKYNVDTTNVRTDIISTNEAYAASHPANYLVEAGQQRREQQYQQALNNYKYTTDNSSVVWNPTPQKAANGRTYKGVGQKAENTYKKKKRYIDAEDKLNTAKTNLGYATDPWQEEAARKDLELAQAEYDAAKMDYESSQANKRNVAKYLTPEQTSGKGNTPDYGTAGGNIDLANRPVLRNEDGSYSTVDSVIWTDNKGNDVVLPKVIQVDGKWIHTDDEGAWKHYEKTGEYLAKFKTTEDHKEAMDYSTKLHEDQAKLYQGQMVNSELYNQGKELLDIAKTTSDPQLADLITSIVGTDAEEDTFKGQTKSSFNIGKIQELQNQAMGKYGQTENEEDWKIAQAYAKLANYYQAVNQEALDDKNVKAGMISQDMARYAPQFLEQTKASAGRIAAGAAAGAVIGELVTPVPILDGLIGAVAGGVKGALGGAIAGSKVGGMSGSIKYSYNTMRGAALHSLVEKGADLEYAREASKDEAIISASIENLDTAFDLLVTIPGLSKGVGQEVAKGVVKKAAGYLGNIAQEYGEEFAQEVISIANERRVDPMTGKVRTGVVDLGKEVIAVAQEILSGSEEGKEYLQRANEAGRGGGVIGAFMAPAGAIVNRAVTSPAQTAAMVTLNNAEGNANTHFNNSVQLAGLSNDTLKGLNKEWKAELQKKYEADVKSGTKTTVAAAKIRAEVNMGSEIYNEYTKERTKAQAKADRVAFHKNEDIIRGAEEKQVLVDGDGHIVGTVIKTNKNGIVVEYKDGKREAVYMTNNAGLLDSKSRIANYLNDDGDIIDEKDAFDYENPSETKPQHGERVTQMQEKLKDLEHQREEARKSGNSVAWENLNKEIQTLNREIEDAIIEEFRTEGREPVNPNPKGIPYQPEESAQTKQKTPSQQPAAKPVEQKTPEQQKQERMDSLLEQIRLLRNAGGDEASIKQLQDEYNRLKGQPTQQQAAKAERPINDFVNKQGKKNGEYTEGQVGNVKYKIVYNKKTDSYDLKTKKINKDGSESVKYHTIAGGLSKEGLGNQIRKLLGQTPQKASESPQNASPEKGKSVPPQTQKASQVPSEKLNSKAENYTDIKSAREGAMKAIVRAENTEGVGVKGAWEVTIQYKGVPITIKHEAGAKNYSVIDGSTGITHVGSGISYMVGEVATGVDLGTNKGSNIKAKEDLGGKKKIDSFRDDNSFLSNMFDSPVTFEGKTYKSAEAAFQAAKTTDQNERERFTKMSGKEAKAAGKKVKLRDDWDSARIKVMRQILKEKFKAGTELAQKLIATGDADLVEGNKWGDTFWGAVDGKGDNNLGKLLMEIRDNLQGKFNDEGALIEFVRNWSDKTYGLKGSKETSVSFKGENIKIKYNAAEHQYEVTEGNGKVLKGKSIYGLVNTAMDDVYDHQNPVQKSENTEKTVIPPFKKTQQKEEAKPKEQPKPEQKAEEKPKPKSKISGQKPLTTAQVNKLTDKTARWRLYEWARELGVSTKTYGLINRIMDAAFGNDTTGQTSGELHLSDVVGAQNGNGKVSGGNRYRSDGKRSIDKEIYENSSTPEAQEREKNNALYNWVRNLTDSYGAQLTMREIEDMLFNDEESDIYTPGRNGRQGRTRTIPNNVSFKQRAIFQFAREEIESLGLDYDLATPSDVMAKLNEVHPYEEPASESTIPAEAYQNEIADLILRSQNIIDEKTGKSLFERAFNEGYNAAENDRGSDSGDFIEEEESREEGYGQFSADDDPYTYDWQKVSAFMAENNESNVQQRLTTLEETFPEREFRISDDGGHIEEVYGHSTAKTQYGREERSYWEKNGWKMVSDNWTEKVYGTNYLLPEMIPDRKNLKEGQTGKWIAVEDKETGKVSFYFDGPMKPNPSLVNKRANGSHGNRDIVRTVLNKINDKLYYYNVGQGMFRHVLDSGISEGIDQVISAHEERVKELERKIQEVKAAMPSGILPKTGHQDRGTGKSPTLMSLRNELETYEYQLKQEQAWLDKVENGIPVENNKNRSYTLSDFLGDDFISQDEKNQVIPEQAFIGYKFKALRNAMSKDFANELFNDLQKMHLEEYYGEYQGRRTDQELQTSSSLGSSPESNWTDLRTGEQRTATGLSAYDTPDTRPAAEEVSGVRGSTGSGEILDESGTVREVYGPQRGDRQGVNRGATAEKQSRNAQRVTDDLNQSFEEQVTIQEKGSQAGATVTAKQINNDTYLEGEAVGAVDPEKYSGTLKSIAQTILNAAKDFGVSVVQLKGRLIRTHTDADGNYFTTFLDAYADLNEGYVATAELTKENSGKVILDQLHEITHAVTEAYLGGDTDKTRDFVLGIGKSAGVDIESKAKKVILLYSADGVTFDGAVANELISRIAEGDDCGGLFTQKELEKLQEELFDSAEFKEAVWHSQAYRDLAEYSRTQLRNRPDTPDYGKNKAATNVGFTPSTAPHEERLSSYNEQKLGNEADISSTLAEYNREIQKAREQGNFARELIYMRKAYNIAQGLEEDSGVFSDELASLYGENKGRNSNIGLKPDATEAQKRATQFRAKEDLGEDRGEPVSNSQLGVIEDFGVNKVDDMWGMAAPKSGPFQYTPEVQEVLNEMYSEDPDKLLQPSNETWQEAMTAGRYIPDEDTYVRNYQLKREKGQDKKTGAERFSVKNEGDPENQEATPWERIQKSDRRIDRVSRKTAMNNLDKMTKVLGKETQAGRDMVQNYKALQNMRKKVLSGDMSVTEMYHRLQNMHGSTGIGQVINDKVLALFKSAAQLEQLADAYGEDSIESSAFKRMTANAMEALQNQVERVDRVEYGWKYKLAESAKKNGRTGKNPAYKAREWLNRMQISGDNFWRMIDGYNRGTGQGYQLARRDKQNVAESAKRQTEALAYFQEAKQTKDWDAFASGKAKGQYDTLVNEISLNGTLNTLMKEFKDKKGKTHRQWDKSILESNGFSYEDAKGNLRYIEFQTATPNERAKELDKMLETSKADIDGSEAATAYLNAANLMFEYMSTPMSETFQKINGYNRKMFEAGKYFPVRYIESGVDNVKNRDNWQLIDNYGGINNIDYMKRRGGTNAEDYYIHIAPASRVIDEYIKQASNYIAFADFGADLRQMMSTDGLTDNFATIVGKNFGKTWGEWFMKYTKDMNMISDPDLSGGLRGLVAKAGSNMMQAAIVGSMSVPIKQTASFWSAGGVVSMEALRKAYGGAIRKSAKQVGLGAPENVLVRSRGAGSLDTYASDALVNSWITRMRDHGGPLGKLFVSATNVMDSRTVANVYQACVYDVEMNNPGIQMYTDDKKTELTPMAQFLVDSKFEEAVMRTQPVFTKQARSEFARSDDPLIRMLATFRTQQNQNWNLTLTAMEEYKAAKKAGTLDANAKTQLKQTIKGQLTSYASISALNILADVFRHKLKKYKDDDDEWDWGKVLERFGKNYLEAAMGTYQFGDYLAQILVDAADGKLLDSYDKEFNGIYPGVLGSARSWIQSLSYLVKDLTTNYGKKSGTYARMFISNTAQLFSGYPIGNGYTIVNSGVQWYKDIFGKGSKEYEDLTKAWDAIRTDYGNILLDSAKTGNAKGEAKAKNYLMWKAEKSAAADDVIEEGEIQSKFFSNLETMVKNTGFERFKDGTDDREDYVNALMTYGGMDEAKAEEYVTHRQMEIDTATKDNPDGYKFDNLKSDWLAGIHTDEEAMEYMQKYGGKDAIEAADTLDTYKKDKAVQEMFGKTEHGKNTVTTYSGLGQAYTNDIISRDDYKKALTEIGGVTEEVAEENALNFDCKKEYGYKLSEMGTKYQDGLVSIETFKDAQKKYSTKDDKEIIKAVKTQLTTAFNSGTINRNQYIQDLQKNAGMPADEAILKANQEEFKAKFGESWSKTELKRQYQAKAITDNEYVRWYQYCEGESKETAEYYLDNVKQEIKFGHVADYKHTSDYSTVYSSKTDKLGIDELYDKYGSYFKNARSLGKVFNDFVELKKTSKYGEMTYMYNGQKTEMSAEYVAQVKALNKNLEEGNITYEAAKIIWHEKWGRSLYPTGPWQYVKAP